MSVAIVTPYTQPLALTNGVTWPHVYSLPGSGWKTIYGLGVAGSPPSYGKWRLLFLMRTNVLPSSVVRLQLQYFASSPGTARVNPQWAMCASGVDPSGLSLSSEGPFSVVRAAGDENKLKVESVPLDALAVGAGQMLIMDLGFDPAGWTLPSVSVWSPYIEFF